MIEPRWTPPEEFEEYRLVRLLGRGTMGEVYLAHDSLLDRPVAVKFMQAAGDPTSRAQLFDEARAIARLQHPNVVAVYRIAEVSGHPYLVSEYVRGRPLDQLERPAPSRQVLEIALDLARGLAAAPRCGVLHRDVKPANAILTDEGRAKLLDFGVASVGENLEPPQTAPPRERFDARAYGRRIASDTTRSLRVVSAADDDDEPVLDTVDGELASLPLRPRQAYLVGTPLYMAPELWRGEPATRRSDLYALGILLYEMLSGTAPHRGISMAALGELLQSHDIPRLGDVAPATDPALAAIVDRLVERDAGARF